MKVNLVKDIFDAFVWKKNVLGFDLAKVPSDKMVEKLIRVFRRRYPKLYLVLVQERNIFMARALVRLRKDVPELPIIAVVGAGHAKEMVRLLKKFEKDK